jgi:hypothetical protein
VPFRAAGFNEANAIVRWLGQASSEHTAGGTGTDNDVVEILVERWLIHDQGRCCVVQAAI